MARLLLPEAFGSFALIGALVGPFASLTNVGMTALVARESSPSSTLLATARWVNRVAVAALAGLLALALLIWSAVSAPAGVLAPGAVVAFATALYVVPQIDIGVLQQRRDFRSIALLDITFDAVWTVTAVSIALLRPSIWALALAEAAAQAVRALVARLFAGPTSHPELHREQLRHILRFSAASLSGSVLWSVVFALPAWLMHRHCGDGAIGQFSLAYAYAQIASLALGGIAARIALPALGRAAEHERIQVAWTYTESVSLALAPVTAVLSAVGPPILSLLAGPRWIEAGPVLSILAWGMAARVAFPFGTLAQAVGRPILDVAFAALTILLFAGLELGPGWVTPGRAGLFVALTDVAVCCCAVALARLLWGGSGGRAVRVAVIWGTALLASGLAYLFPRSHDALASPVIVGLVIVAVYSVSAACIPWLATRYRSEILGLWRVLRARRASSPGEVA